MFIPQGKTLYENLATSYVLVDALVDDLCAEGFSGFVKVALNAADVHVLLDGGSVAAVLEQRKESAFSGASDYADTTVAELAKQSRRERGRVSIHQYPSGVAAALARGRAAEPLYLRLSSDFADLGKMIAKLGREQDREWFIQVSLPDGPAALVHLKDGDCRVIRPGGVAAEAPANSLDPSVNMPLGELLNECGQAGCVFDVHFKRATELPEQAGDKASATPGESSLAAADGGEAGEGETPGAAPDSMPLTTDEAVIAPPDAPVPDELPAEPEPVWAQAPQEMPPDPLAGSATGDDLPAFSEHYPDAAKIAPEAADTGNLEEEQEAKPSPARRLMTTGDLRSGGPAEELAEVKRLMGEIARAIEDAIRLSEARDRFAINLREGQLRVADEFPFLDPFGAEFEYLAGEIVFVGRADPAEFIAGLTEALRIAVAGAAASSLQPARLRARIAADLHDVLESNRADFERFYLDQAIERIVA